MADERFDVVVVGAGPAGSVCALVLARGGARVALVDKAAFPRDKACGDLVGPRGVQVLRDLGLDAPTEVPVLGDMLVVGPTGDRVLLPSATGLSYPGMALAIPRVSFDDRLRSAAAEAGARTLTRRVASTLRERGRVSGLELDDGRRLLADVVVAADGATSAVAERAGLVDPSRVLWGFALRCYVEACVGLPTIVMWEPDPHEALCGYGWIFPGPGGQANVGLGVGTMGDRRGGARAVHLLPRFLEHLRVLGLLAGEPATQQRRLGGWLKMGMVGTVPAGAGVLAVGDAAGLVNPLQGEGIAHAMTSARSAAEAILASPSQPGALYTGALRSAHLPYLRVASVAHAALLSRPRALSRVCRLLTTPALGNRLSDGWAVLWNELSEGAPPGRARNQAVVAMALGRALTSGAALSRWFDETFSRGEAVAGSTFEGRFLSEHLSDRGHDEQEEQEGDRVHAGAVQADRPDREDL